MEDKLKNRLKKLYELSVRGVGGEKSSADRMLNKLLDKHNVTIEDIIDNIPKKRYYKYRSNEHKTIICQIIFSVNNEVDVYTSTYGHNKEVSTTVTDYENVQIIELIEFHLDLYKKERKQFLKDFTHAYVQKHRLFSDKTDEEEKPLTAKEKIELMRIYNIYSNLSDKSHTKRISN